VPVHKSKAEITNIYRSETDPGENAIDRVVEVPIGSRKRPSNSNNTKMTARMLKTQQPMSSRWVWRWQAAAVVVFVAVLSELIGFED
jgi:hypothetical protein